MKTPPRIYGLTTTKLAALAKQAVQEAIRDSVQAGHPVTGELNGKVVTLQANDHRFANLQLETDAAIASSRPV
ncbi:MAG: hypothetical protein IV107_24285 [Paucibacter sp.]|nr:hypothetical protein [Roseateles sp.]